VNDFLIVSLELSFSTKLSDLSGNECGVDTLNFQGLLKKSEMRWMQGTDIDDVYLIIRNGCKEANTVFLASF